MLLNMLGVGFMEMLVGLATGQPTTDVLLSKVFFKTIHYIAC